MMRFPTKVDTWLVAVLGLGLVAPIALAVSGGISHGLANRATWLPFAVEASVAALVAALTLPTYYDVQASRIVIRSGLLRWEVPLEAITSIVPTSNPLSSPAWSLQRLEVRSVQNGRSRSILISPRQRVDFMREVASRDPLLLFDGQEIRRARRLAGSNTFT